MVNSETIANQTKLIGTMIEQLKSLEGQEIDIKCKGCGRNLILSVVKDVDDMWLGMEASCHDHPNTSIIYFDETGTWGDGLEEPADGIHY